MKALKSIAALAVFAALAQPVFADDAAFTANIGSGFQNETISAPGGTTKQTIPMIRAGIGYNDGAMSYAASFAYGKSTNTSVNQSINGHYSQIDGRVSYHVGLGDSFAISPVLGITRVNQSINGESVDINYATSGVDVAWQMSQSFGMVLGAGVGYSFANSAGGSSVKGGMVYTAALKSSYAISQTDNIDLSYDYRKANLADASLKSSSLMLNWTHSF